MRVTSLSQASASSPFLGKLIPSQDGNNGVRTFDLCRITVLLNQLFYQTMVRCLLTVKTFDAKGIFASGLATVHCLAPSVRDGWRGETRLVAHVPGAESVIGNASNMLRRIVRQSVKGATA